MTEEHEPIEADDSTGVGPRLVLLGVLAVAFGAFVIQNTEGADVNWLVFDFSLPLWALLIGSACVGVLIRDIVVWIRRRRA